MSNFYDNSIVPNELKRNFDVYDRIRELNIDLGTYPNSFARVTTLPLICAESKNASFKAKCAFIAL